MLEEIFLPSDITIVEEDVTEDEKKIIQLVRSGA